MGGCNKSVAVELEFFALDTSKYCSPQWINGILQWQITASWFPNMFRLKNRATRHVKSSTRKDFSTRALEMGINVQIYTIVLSLPSILSKWKSTWESSQMCFSRLEENNVYFPSWVTQSNYHFPLCQFVLGYWFWRWNFEGPMNEKPVLYRVK